MQDLILFLFAALLFLFLGYLLGKLITHYRWKEKVPEIREDAVSRSRAVLGGQFSEQLAPYLPDFPYSPTEVKFLGKPVDFLAFKGLDGKEITEVIFVEVKSSRSSLSKTERSLRDAILAKRVKWEEYRIPEDLTRKK